MKSQESFSWDASSSLSTLQPMYIVEFQVILKKVWVVLPRPPRDGIGLFIDSGPRDFSTSREDLSLN